MRQYGENLLDYQERIEIENASLLVGEMLDDFTREIERVGGRVQLRDATQLVFTVPMSGRWSPFFQADGGRFAAGSDGTAILFQISYRRSAWVAALGVAVVVTFGIVTGGFDLSLLIFPFVGWLWLWGTWRLIMPYEVARLVRRAATRARSRSSVATPAA